MKYNIDDAQLQAAIDEAYKATQANNLPRNKAIDLGLAKAFLARLPEPSLANELQRLACEKSNEEAIKEVQQYAAGLTLNGVGELIMSLKKCLPDSQAPAVEAAGICTDCGGEVNHRDGHPGEFDHKCDAEKPDPYADILLPESLPIAALAQDQVQATPEMEASQPAEEAEPEPATTWQPAVGDVVTLKSGGPKMTIVCEAGSPNNKNCFWCNWFNGTELVRGIFPASTLQPA